MDSTMRQVRQKLTLYDGIATIMGLMIGSGIFATVGDVQKGLQTATMAFAIWIITGVLALTGALCYAELGTMIPGSGGEGQYLGQGLGALFAFLFNWTSILVLKPGTVAILSDHTAKYIFRTVLTMSGSLDVEGQVKKCYWILKGCGVFFCFAVTLAASLSTLWSNRIQGVLTFGKVGAMTLVIVPGLYYAFKDVSILSSNLAITPVGGAASLTIGNFFPSLWSSFYKTATEVSFIALVLALNNGLWSFEGWNNLNIVAGDLANPSVNLPLCIWTSVVSVLSFYLMTLLGYYSVLEVSTIEASSTVGLAFGKAAFASWFLPVMPVLIACSTFSAALSSMVTSSEIILLAAHTGQAPRYFGKISPTLGTAFRAYWMQGILAAGLIFAEEKVSIYMVAQWLFYALCVVVLLKYRYTHPALLRPYRVWLVTPVFFLAACCWLVGTTFYEKTLDVGILFVVIALGIPIFFISRRFFNACPENDKEPMTDFEESKP